ncbi:MAG: flagellar hook-associated protein FlgL [Woeseiaceae bacterium]
MPRVSTNQMQSVAINSMLKQHETLSRVQQQVATGKKIFKPSEDPVAAARVVNLKDTLSSVHQYQSNVDAAKARITLSEGVLASVVDSIQRVRELTVQANNDSQNDETRGYIAAEVKQIQDEILNLANTTDSNNEYLYAGALSRSKPFSRNEVGGFEYNGDESNRQIQISHSRRIAVDDPGSKVFLEIKNGNGIFNTQDAVENKGTGVIDPGQASGDFLPDTYAIIFDKSHKAFEGAFKFGEIPLTYSVVNSKGGVISAGIPFQSDKEISFNGIHTSIKGEPMDGDVFVIKPSQNQDIFTTLENLISALDSSNPEVSDRISFHNALNRSLVDISQSLDNILEVRGDIGSRLNALDAQETINEAYTIQIREILSNVEDLDYAEAVSRLNLELTGLEASQKAFTRVQNISLFNYI